MFTIYKRLMIAPIHSEEKTQFELFYLHKYIDIHKIIYFHTMLLFVENFIYYDVKERIKRNFSRFKNALSNLGQLLKIPIISIRSCLQKIN